MGIVGPIVGSGAFLGPMISGVLLPMVGYWWTWSVAIAMIALDLMLRLAMTERPKAAECVASYADVKTGDRSEAEIHGGPGANTRDQDSCSIYSARSGTGSEQCK